MNWSKIKGYISQYAPMIGAALGGPIGGAAGALVSDVLGLPKDAKPEDISKYIEAQRLTPEQIVALKQADNEFSIKMRELDIKSVQEMEALAVQDRDSARKREMTVLDKTPQIGFYAITIGFFAILFYMFKYPVPEAGREALMVMLGSLGTAWIQAVSYYYGSSSGSDAKTKILAGKSYKS